MPKIISIEQRGDFKAITYYLKNLNFSSMNRILHKYGKIGVTALQNATPINTGLTASSWYYEVDNEDGVAVLRFCNSNLTDEWCPVAIILQYGHATGTGGWVEGIDYINPALKPVFDQLAEEAWKEVLDS